MQETLKVIMVGDVVGEPGMLMCQRWLTRLKHDHKADFLVVNAENAGRSGRGMSEQICESLFDSGADVITSGNHVWHNDKFSPYLDRAPRVVRPLNYPSDCPGKGYCIVKLGDGTQVAVVNAMGRVFMRENLSCPLREVKNIVDFLQHTTKIILVDFHAEATSEKQALAYYLDGEVSAVVGTHTHVPTADERILPGGTAIMCDLGFVGPLNSCIGMQKETVINHSLTQMPPRFCVEKNPPYVLCGLLLEIDKKSGKTTALQRLRLEDSQLKC